MVNLLQIQKNLKNVVSLTAPNKTSKVKVLREGAEKILRVKLEELPEDPTTYGTKKQTILMIMDFN